MSAAPVPRRSFPARVWALLVAVKDGLALLFLLLFFTLLFAVLTARPSAAQVRPGALLLQLDGFIVEERSPVDFLSAFLSRSAPTGEFPSRDLVRALDAAAGDPRIKAVVLDLDRFLGGGQVHLREVGAALDRVRRSNKPVLAYATLYADDAYLLASHATEIWVNPMGGAMLTGMGGNSLYFGDLLERLNINARVYRVGTYKSAVEPYTLNGPSPEAEENARALYGALWEEWLANVRTARPRANLALVANDPVAWLEGQNGDVARASLAAGMVDRVGDRFTFEERVAELVGADAASDTGYAHSQLQPWLRAVPTPRSGGAIGVVTISGAILDGAQGPGTAGAERIADLLDDALDDDLKGLVVRIDSPGGSVLGSEVIRQAILRHKVRNRTPIAVSMANVAASGGYWVATPADRIFAEPATITGSIGVFAVLPTFERLAAEWGVSSAGVGTTPLSGQPDFIGGFNEPVDRVLQLGVEHTYRDFIAKVAAARRLPPERVDALGQGRVWDGGTARQVGLIDQFGGTRDALAWVAAQAQLADGAWHAVELGGSPSTYDTLLRQLFTDETRQQEGGTDVAGFIARQQQVAVQRLAVELERLAGRRGLQAYCTSCAAAVPGTLAPSEPLQWWTSAAEVLRGLFR
ncbi:signal peptide peptidase SppA [Erythrobacteraceae bacterium CFH 75059]|uniref:signal peptide peptidase SppA n=1 Tax=Qipengyuania thermophila TaxID=2509361 RepID=UPI00101F0FFD|nr:signal peptide peptidase SppA [Qipengyuania thermophila]TCD04127.1 signal peptide peptidase SppA [Erythrobacteraceae bacterium CFH 75059]